MIALTTETTLSLDQAARLIPPSRSARRTHLSTVLRWILRGARNPSGERVRLEAVRLGGKWVTSLEALQRFTDRLTPDLDASSTLPPRSPGKRQRASDRAARELERLGI
jgi:hypothetical protein